MLKKARQTRGGKNNIQSKESFLKNLLSDIGLNETLSYSFINENIFDKILLPKNSESRNVLKLKNPLSDDVAVMRTLLFPSLLKIASLNIRKSNKNLNLFEIGNVYIPVVGEDVQPLEYPHLCILQSGNGKDFFEIKKVTETIASNFNLIFAYKPANETFMHPGRSAYIFNGKKKIGIIGEIHPDVAENFETDQKIYIAEIDLNLLFKDCEKEIIFNPIPK